MFLGFLAVMCDFCAIDGKFSQYDVAFAGILIEIATKLVGVDNCVFITKKNAGQGQNICIVY
jgi:hypothetical protein